MVRAENLRKKTERNPEKSPHAFMQGGEMYLKTDKEIRDAINGLEFTARELLITMKELRMGLFNKSSKDKDSSELKDILSIPYDYSGYDLVFEEGTTEPGVYAEINALVTNGGMDISEVDGYEDLSEDSSEDEFWEFYDNWIETLEENGYVTELTMADDIGAFAAEINRILGNIGAPEKLDTEAAASAFRAEVVKYSFQGKPVDENFKYDILEANIVCAELRKIGYELIAFFNGADNNVKAVIPLDRIAAMEELERRIK